MLFTLKLHCVIFLLILYTQLVFFGVLSLVYFSVLKNLRFSVNYLNLFLMYLNISKNHEWGLNIAKCFSAFMSLSLDKFFSPGAFWQALGVISGSSSLSLELIPLFSGLWSTSFFIYLFAFVKHAVAAAKSLQSCPTLCDPTDGSPSGSPVPGILQARTLEWVAISFSNAWKWKVKVKSLSCVWLLETPWTVAHQASPSMGFSRQQYWSGMPLKHTHQ